MGMRRLNSSNPWLNPAKPSWAFSRAPSRWSEPDAHSEYSPDDRAGVGRPALERHEPTDPSLDSMKACRLRLRVPRIHEMQCGSVRQGDIPPQTNLAD